MKSTSAENSFPQSESRMISTANMATSKNKLNEANTSAAAVKPKDSDKVTMRYTSFLDFNRRTYTSTVYRISVRMGVCLFGAALIVVGILVVCFKSPKHTSRPCLFTLQSRTLTPASHHSRPSFVSVGDFNNDQRLDIVVANSDANLVSIMFGYGNGSFTTEQTYTTGPQSYPCSIAIGDFDSDFVSDIAVANYFTNNIGLFIGYANGTFANQRTFSLGSSRPLSIIAGDFNKDAWLDIAVANDGTDSIGILLGYGNGYFQDQVIYSTGYDSLPHSIAAADFNNDTKLDIIVANYGSKALGIFLGYGNGSFANQTVFYTVSRCNPYAIVIGDFNDDSRSDIAVAYYDQDSIGIFLDYGNGYFFKETIFPVSPGSNPLSIIVSDFNRDNHHDIVIANYKNNSISVFLGYGDGTFANQVTYSTGLFSQPKSIAIGDFNNDTRIDMVVANSNTNEVDILLGYDPAAFQSKITFSTGIGSGPGSISIGDFNQDNCLDIVVANYYSYAVGIFLGSGNGAFVNVGTYTTGFFSRPKAVATGNFNNDDYLDIVFVNYNTHDFGVLLGYGNGSFFQIDLVPPLKSIPPPFLPIYSTGYNSFPCTVNVGDFNNDNLLDVVISYSSLWMVGIFLGYGDARFSSQQYIATDCTVQSVAVADFNNDFQLDIVLISRDNSKVQVFLGNGNGTFRLYFSSSTGFEPMTSSVTVGDFNGDDILDLAVANPNYFNIGLLFGYGNGSFATQITYSTNFPVYSVVGSDLNKDNRLDIVAVSSSDNVIAAFVAYGNGHFVMEKPYSTGSSPHSAAVGDFNKDNRPDCAIPNFNSNNVDIFLGYDYGRVEPLTTYPSTPLPRPLSVAVGDFNNDTQLDIVVTNSGTDTIGVFIADDNATFESQYLYDEDTGSLVYSVASDDFDRDNQLDLVAANYGANNVAIFNGYGNGSFARPVLYPIGSGTNPISVTTGDLNNDNWPDIAVANDGTNTIGILLGYDPALFSNTNTYTNLSGLGSISFAVGDFNNDSRIDVAIAYYGSNDVGILLGHGNGTFLIGKTYITDSKPYSIVVDDLNNDNRLDIVVANSDSNSISVFLGYGDGTFANRTPYTAGSSPKSVVVNDLNKDSFLDIVVANNGEHTISVFLGYGDGRFAPQTIYPTGSGPYSVVVGDINQDSCSDIVVANNNDSSFGVLLGYGNGTFASQSAFYINPWSNLLSIAIGDFDADNKLDIAVANKFGNTITVFLGDGNGKFPTQHSYSTGLGSNPRSIIVVDMNNDGHLDIAFSTSGVETIIEMVSNEQLDVNVGYTSVGILLGYGDGTFFHLRTYNTGSHSGPFFIAASDFNKDKRLDIIIIDFRKTNICVLFGYKYALFKNAVMLSSNTASHPRSIIVADFNNDKKNDVLVANSGHDNLNVFLGIGDGTFMSPITYSTGVGSQPYSVAFGDFNRDQWLDIIVAKYGSDCVSLYFGYGNGTFGNEVTYFTGPESQPYSLKVGNFNNDDWLDVVVVKFGSNSISVMFGNSNGTLEAETTHLVGYETRPCSVAVGDFNNDNRLDMVITNVGTNNLEIILNLC